MEDKKDLFKPPQQYSQLNIAVHVHSVCVHLHLLRGIAVKCAVFTAAKLSKGKRLGLMVAIQLGLQVILCINPGHENRRPSKTSLHKPTS